MKGISRVIAVAVILLGLAAAATGANARSSDLFIIAGGDTILAGSDISTFDRATGGLSLTADGSRRWSRWEQSRVIEGRKIPALSRLTGQPFRLEVSGALLAEGHFTSVLSSTLYPGLVLYDSLIRSGDHHLRFTYGELPDSSHSPDPCESEAFLGYFRTRGKLVEGERGR